MTDILNENKLSTFRKYFLEVTIFALAVCLAFTVRFVIELNNNFFKYVTDDKQTTIIQLQKSTEALDNNTDALKEMIDLRKELYLEPIKKK